MNVTVLEAAAHDRRRHPHAELTVPGVLHDDCSAVHPMARRLAGLRVARPGARTASSGAGPRSTCAHPLDDGSRGRDAALDRRDGGRRWAVPTGRPGAALFERSVGRLRGARRGHRAPGRCTSRGTRCGSRASDCRRRLPATLVARSVPDALRRAPCSAGVAAHALSPLTQPLSSAVGMALICAGHPFGWPVARGGSRAITDALAAVLPDHGGTIETGRVASSPGRASAPPTPSCSTWRRPACRAWPATGCRRASRAPTAATATGPAAFKVDLAVEGGVPWTNEACRRAGTVHVGGLVRGGRGRRARDQPRPDARAARSCWSASSTSPTRSAPPATSTRSGPTPTSRPATPATRPAAILDQIERFAPGPARADRRARRCARPRRSPPRTRTSSAATSSPAPTPPGSC